MAGIARRMGRRVAFNFSTWHFLLVGTVRRTRLAEKRQPRIHGRAEYPERHIVLCCLDKRHDQFSADTLSVISMTSCFLIFSGASGMERELEKAATVRPRDYVTSSNSVRKVNAGKYGMPFSENPDSSADYFYFPES